MNEDEISPNLTNWFDYVKALQFYSSDKTITSEEKISQILQKLESYRECPLSKSVIHMISMDNIEIFPFDVLTASGTLNWNFFKKSDILSSSNQKNIEALHEYEQYIYAAPFIKRVSLRLFENMRNMTANQFHEKYEKFYDILPHDYMKRIVELYFNNEHLLCLLFGVAMLERTFVNLLSSLKKANTRDLRFNVCNYSIIF